MTNHIHFINIYYYNEWTKSDLFHVGMWKCYERI